MCRNPIVRSVMAEVCTSVLAARVTLVTMARSASVMHQTSDLVITTEHVAGKRSTLIIMSLSDFLIFDLLLLESWHLYRDESSPVCSGRGNCVCGVCDCGPVGGDPSRRYSGQYCHCNDLDCAWDGDLLCGGPERGECQCGQCRCKGYWTRPDRACNCDGRTDTCIASNGVGIVHDLIIVALYMDSGTALKRSHC